MCGLLALYKKGFGEKEKALQEETFVKALKTLSHRGPDCFDSKLNAGHGLLGHTRLSIVDLKDGDQPFEYQGTSWIHNGEIYNHEDLRGQLAEAGLKLASKSDSSVIGLGLIHWGSAVFDKLDGVFATVLFHEGQVFAARDPLGVKPLFYGKDDDGQLWFASEMKALKEQCSELSLFPPGHYYSTEEGFVQYYKPDYQVKAPSIDTEAEALKRLRETLIASTQKRLMADVEVGALLSGGLDSSLVAAIAAKELAKKGKKLTTFSIGLHPDTPDLIRAREVAKHIGSTHHEILFTEEEGKGLLKEMVHLLETYDITTVRASTPMYIMSKYIKALGIKVVLSGEGADEIFGGYLYFGHAPSEEEFHKECLRRVGLLHTADLLRADRSTMAASVEARVPFLDKEFLEVSMAVSPHLKVYTDESGAKRQEKWILRQAFAGMDLIPDSVLWRQKEQFSDGVGYSWVDGLKEFAETTISDEEFSQAEVIYPYQSPATKEAFLYRKFFSQIFTQKDCEKQIKKWIPKWQDYNIDPSGRANKGHDMAYEGEVKKTEPAIAK